MVSSSRLTKCRVVSMHSTFWTVVAGGIASAVGKYGMWERGLRGELEYR